MTLLAAAVEQPSCYSRTVNDWWCGAYLRDYRTELVDATVQHLLITVSAIGLGLALLAALGSLVWGARLP